MNMSDLSRKFFGRKRSERRLEDWEKDDLRGISGGGKDYRQRKKAYKVAGDYDYLTNKLVGQGYNRREIADMPDPNDPNSTIGQTWADRAYYGGAPTDDVPWKYLENVIKKYDR